MLKYWLWLTTRKGLTPRETCRVARYFVSPEAAYFASAEDYKAVAGLRNASGLMDKDLSQANAILEQCREKNIRLITMQDAAYPNRLSVLEDAPVVLYCRGSLPDLNEPMVAVVGSRKASTYGLIHAKRLSFGLAKSGCMVVSGGAAGVDTEAIRGALLGGGTAIVVLACGVDVNYPAENKQLFREVAERGCLLSEYPPGTRPDKYRFPVRNRILSGLSLGVLITEAPERSGALITARHALEQGRDVFVLPANVGVDNCKGNLKLLRDGAIPVGTAWDIVQEYQPQYPKMLKKSMDEPKEETHLNDVTTKKVIDKPKTKAYIDLKETQESLSEVERKMMQLLGGGMMHIDDIVEQMRLPAAQALSVLTRLEIKGLLCRPSAGMYEPAEK